MTNTEVPALRLDLAAPDANAQPSREQRHVEPRDPGFGSRALVLRFFLFYCPG